MPFRFASIPRPSALAPLLPDLLENTSSILRRGTGPGRHVCVDRIWLCDTRTSSRQRSSRTITLWDDQSPLVSICERPSGNNLFRHDSGHVGQPEISPAVSISQPFMIEPEQMQHSRVEVVDVHAVFDGVVADVVRGAVNEAGFEAA